MAVAFPAPPRHSMIQMQIHRPLPYLGVALACGVALVWILWRAWPSLFLPPTVEILLREGDWGASHAYYRVRSSTSQDAIRMGLNFDGKGARTSQSWSSSRGRFGRAWIDAATTRMPDGSNWVFAVAFDTIYRLERGETLVVAASADGAPLVTFTAEPDQGDQWGSLRSEAAAFWRALRGQESYRNHLHQRYPDLPIRDVESR